MTTLHLDFETYSACELKTAGAYNYATHPTTGVHCMALAFDDRPVGLWLPAEQDPDSQIAKDVVSEHIADGGEVVAHNAIFEYLIWNHVCVPKYGWPRLKLEQLRCTMAQCYAMSLPGSLEKAAAALGIEQRKDMVGARVMMQLAKPREDGTFWTPEEAPEKFEKLYAYCRQDVEVERKIDNRTMRLSPTEQKVWVLDQQINLRGIHVDLPSVENAIRMVAAEKARLDAEMLSTTGGVVGKCTEVQLLVKWIRSQGVEINGLAKADVLDAMATDGLPNSVRKALSLRKEAAKSSTAKLIAMRDRASADGRIRGCFQYHGASTGRWAHRGIQPGNLPRPRKLTKDDDANVELIYHINDLIRDNKRDELDMLYGPTMDAVADSIRGMITAAPGNTLIAMDFSAIEARVLPWLAGEESVLDIFRTHGKIYEHAASGIYGVPLEQVTKDQRQIGKVAVLALGYGGGVGAFQSMARVYGVKVPDAQADEIKVAWRKAHPNIVKYWYALEDAAINAVELGERTSAGPKGREVKFVCKGSFLWCQLPSGRVLCYPYPQIKMVDTPWNEQKPCLHFMSVNGTTNKWEETSTYGGSLAENVTQAVARDVLAEAMLGLESVGYDIVMHVHDEVVVEELAPLSGSTNDLNIVQDVVTIEPTWAAGLPIAAEGWMNRRYRK